MNEKYKELIIQLSDRLEKECSNFMLELANREYETDPNGLVNIGDMINLILSGYISSLTNSMRASASVDKVALKQVNRFLSKIIASISQEENIDHVEIMQ